MPLVVAFSSRCVLTVLRNNEIDFLIIATTAVVMSIGEISYLIYYRRAKLLQNITSSFQVVGHFLVQK